VVEVEVAHGLLVVAVPLEHRVGLLAALRRGGLVVRGGRDALGRDGASARAVPGAAVPRRGGVGRWVAREVGRQLGRLAAERGRGGERLGQQRSLAGREERGLRGELGAPLALLLRLPPPLPGAQRLARGLGGRLERLEQQRGVRRGGRPAAALELRRELRVVVRVRVRRVVVRVRVRSGVR